MAWVIAVAVVLILVVLLFAPIEMRLALRPEGGVAFSVHWLGIPFRFVGGKKTPAKSKAAAPKKKKKKNLGPSYFLRMGRAGVAVARAPGVRALLWRTTMRVIDAMELVKAHLTLTIGLGDPMLTGLLRGAFGFARPRLELGDERVRVRLVADFARARFHADGEAIVRTRPFPWIVITLQLLCSGTTWRAWRAWKGAMKPKAADGAQAPK